MRLTLKFELQDGTVHDVVAGPAAIIRWERKFKSKISSLAQAQGMEDLLYLAWEASRIAGVGVAAQFDDFVHQVVEIGAGESEDITPFLEVPTGTSLPS